MASAKYPRVGQTFKNCRRNYLRYLKILLMAPRWILKECNARRTDCYKLMTKKMKNCLMHILLRTVFM